MIKKTLIPLALGGFGIGMTEFVMMGILPDIATNLKISIPEAGYLISAYALGVVLGAPILVGTLANRPPKSVLIWFMILFTAFNALSAFSPDFHLLVISRFLAGLPHGAFFGVGAVVASRLADEGKVAGAVATMFAGLTIANIIGVPAGTYVGHNFSWRFAFLIVAIIGLLTVISLKRWVPHIDANSSASVISDMKIFRNPDLWLALAITSIGTGGFFAWFSYIAPLLTDVSLFAPRSIPLIMAIIGVGMTVGVILGGKLADKFAPIKAITILLATMSILLALNGLLASSQYVMLCLAFTTGATAMALGPPIQMLLMQHSKGAEMLGSSLGQSGFNIGNATGAFLGGIPLTLGYSYSSPQWVATGLAISGGILSMIMLVKSPIRSPSRGLARGVP
ncbi:MFS transporter [Noviherbaspirillum sedimenti]|uniref:MFS transporter n=1 Tax=Noviherbaspirillum sedimenti TaxID=2320865 RepID=A0A3A3G9H2_9BURK|nr:MFS transporter [Noviherbaspirillum sedimenti]